jgi:hypothetical protein
MNTELKLPKDSQKQRKEFCVTKTPILDMRNLYQYILSKLKNVLDEDRRQLDLKDSKILSYLSEIEESEITSHELGDYPAIKALAFAVIEMRDRDHPSSPTIEQIRAMEEKYQRPYY